MNTPVCRGSKWPGAFLWVWLLRSDISTYHLHFDLILIFKCLSETITLNKYQMLSALHNSILWDFTMWLMFYLYFVF